MADCEKCMNENRIESLERDSDRNSIQHREFYAKFNEQQVKQAVVEERYNNLFQLTMKIDATVSKLADAPSRKWDKLVYSIIAAIAAAIVSSIMK